MDSSLAVQRKVTPLWSKSVTVMENTVGVRMDNCVRHTLEKSTPCIVKPRLVCVPSTELFGQGEVVKYNDIIERGVACGFMPVAPWDAVGLRRVWLDQPAEMIAFMAMIPVNDSVPNVFKLLNQGGEAVIACHRVRDGHPFMSASPKRVLIFAAA